MSVAASANSLFYIDLQSETHVAPVEAIARFEVRGNYMAIISKDYRELATLPLADGVAFEFRDSSSAESIDGPGDGDAPVIELRDNALHISGLTHDSFAVIYDLQGRIVGKYDLPAGAEGVIPVSEIRKGYYILSVGTDSYKFKR